MTVNATGSYTPARLDSNSESLRFWSPCPDRLPVTPFTDHERKAFRTTIESIDRLDLGAVIAERQLQYNDPEQHGTCAVQVLLGAPVESAGGGEWYCPYQIIGTGDEQVRAVYGIDAFQSLQLVMKIIGATLYALGENGKRLSWMDNPSGDFGFPWE
jgi:hypothetical protein